MVRPGHPHPQTVKFLIIFFRLVPAYKRKKEKKEPLHVNIFFMYSEHKDSSVLPY